VWGAFLYALSLGGSTIAEPLIKGLFIHIHLIIDTASGGDAAQQGKKMKTTRDSRNHPAVGRVRYVLLFMALVVLFASGCSTLKPEPPQDPLYSLPPAPSGLLATVFEDVSEQLDPEDSGFLLLTHNRKALEWRLALIDNATSSIDAQYFIWDNDEAGTLLFERILKAADRGVRVRLLVDAIGFASTDHFASAMAMHPNFDIKIFNPGKVRSSKLGAMGEFLLYFRELNRRMHNKLFIVDNRMAIVGGRNIGNEYFGLAKKFNFRDLDVLTVGPVVEEISHAFDDYWNADLSYSGAYMSGKAKPGDINLIRESLADYFGQLPELVASYPENSVRWKEKIARLPSIMKTGEAHFLQDEPVSFGGEELRLNDMLAYLAEPSHEEIIIATPYLIPVGDFLKNVKAVSSEGVKVKIITGSMGSNNHTAAHSHYKKYRRRILAAGAELYEFRHDPSLEVREIADDPPVESDFISLHIKALVGDRTRCFIGSLNLDPRALVINTENGLYIQSDDLCEELAMQFESLMEPENAWRVSLDEKDRLRWQSGSEIVTRQPARSFGQRIADFFFRLLPIESQL